MDRSSIYVRSYDNKVAIKCQDPMVTEIECKSVSLRVVESSSAPHGLNP